MPVGDTAQSTRGHAPSMLEERGIELDVSVHSVPSTGSATAYITDPAGVTIELTEGLIDF